MFEDIIFAYQILTTYCKIYLCLVKNESNGGVRLAIDPGQYRQEIR